MFHPRSLTGIALLVLILVIAGLAIASCGNSDMATNVTSGSPLPIYHHKAGDMTPPQARAYWMARRKPGP